MSSSEPNLQRLFSQKSFEESLQVLTQLSLADESPSTEDANPESDTICWDEVAQDLEAFLLQGLDEQEITISDVLEAETISSPATDQAENSDDSLQ